MHACCDAYRYMVALYTDHNHLCWSMHLLRIHFILYIIIMYTCMNINDREVCMIMIITKGTSMNGSKSYNVRTHMYICSGTHFT